MLAGAALSTLPIASLKTQVGTAPASRLVLIPVENRLFTPAKVPQFILADEENTLTIPQQDHFLIPNEARLFEVDE